MSQATTKTMEKEGKMFSHLPNFTRALEAFGDDGITDIIADIDRLKYLGCVASFLYEEESVYEVSHKIEKELEVPKIPRETSPQEFRSILDEVKKKAEEKVKALCGEKKTFLEEAEIPQDEVLSGLEPSAYLRRKFYNEVDSPSCVERLLEWLFTEGPFETVDGSRYEWVFYDFKGTAPTFPTEEELDEFAQFIPCGTAGKIEANGDYTHLYDV